MGKYILTIDQGTTGTTVLLLDRDAVIKGKSYREIRQYYPEPAWVEHDAMEIWQSVEDGIAELFRTQSINWQDIDSIGITNQRETTVVWDSETAEPVHHAIVWQCRRTAGRCRQLAADGREPMIREKTGLLADAYFSSTKLEWILDRYDPHRHLSRSGKLKFGTIDSWIMYRLSRGKEHLTDHSNASRTMLYNIHEKSWDAELLELFNIPVNMLPEVRNSGSLFFNAGPGQSIPVSGVAGDQQAALFGHAAWDRGTIKNTYGTGCFMMINTGRDMISSENGLLTTLACDRLGRPVYALEGSVFIAGAVMQYLRDELGLISQAAESEEIAMSVPDNGGVYFVPAFTGLGAPWWDMDARGAISGLTRGSKKAHIIRAALESIAYQTADVYSLMLSESGLQPRELKADGGASDNAFLMQFQADLLGLNVRKNVKTETTALGAAGLAGLQTGFWSSPESFREKNLATEDYQPDPEKAWAVERYYKGWKTAVERVLTK